MRAPRLKVPASAARAAALAALLAVGACGGEAQSAADDESRPVASAPPEAAAPASPAAPVPAESAPAAGELDATEPPPTAPTTAASPAPAPEASPRPSPVTRRPTPRPAAPSAPASGAAPEAAPVPVPVPEPAPPTVAAGTTVGLRLVGELSTERSAVGDAFEAAVVEDVLSGDGMVLVPAGTVVRGRVAESRESAGPDEPAVLALAVDALELHGRSVPVRATVLDVEIEAGTRDSDARTAAKVGAGAAAGAVLGRILGKDTRSTVKGAVAGAVAGGAVAVATRDGHAVIRDGARILLRLEQALVVER